MAGVGFVVGSSLILREVKRRGFDVDKMISALTWGLVGAIIGARAFTIPAHLDEGLWEALDPFASFSILGGFAGGILAGWWRMRQLDMHVISYMDNSAVGLAMGTVVGRIGDLMIVEHLGAKTDFFLGYLVKPGYDLAPQHNGLERLCEAGDCGPYHHAALYDMAGAALLLGLIYLIARKWPRLRYGMLFMFWMAWYGIQRFLIDFTRNTDLPGADATLGPLTWSQWSGLTVGIVASAIIVWLIRSEKTPLVTAEQDQAYGAAPVG